VKVFPAGKALLANRYPWPNKVLTPVKPRTKPCSQTLNHMLSPNYEAKNILISGNYREVRSTFYTVQSY